jgi:hypothetical protein
MFRCPNERCGVLQFFENEKCTACGKKIKKNKSNKRGKRYVTIIYTKL